MNTLTFASRAVGATTTAQRQEVFRRCLNVLSRPGTTADFGDVVSAATGDEQAFAWASLPILVLADLMTPIASFESDADAAYEVERLCVWTHAVRREPDEARFLLSLGRPTASDVTRINLGTLAEPERSATVCQRVAGFDSGLELVMRGPGIEDTVHVRVDGLDADFFSARAQANADYPRGFDLLLVSDAGRAMGIPRTTRVEVAA